MTTYTIMVWYSTFFEAFYSLSGTALKRAIDVKILASSAGKTWDSNHVCRFYMQLSLVAVIATSNNHCVLIVVQLPPTPSPRRENTMVHPENTPGCRKENFSVNSIQSILCKLWKQIIRLSKFPFYTNVCWILGAALICMYETLPLCKYVEK